MRVMTSMELDEAARRGLVGVDTLVLPEGGRQWMTLGELDAPSDPNAADDEQAGLGRWNWP